MTTCPLICGSLKYLAPEIYKNQQRINAGESIETTHQTPQEWLHPKIRRISGQDGAACNLDHARDNKTYVELSHPVGLKITYTLMDYAQEPPHLQAL